mmetsp:Transcript_3997/g.12025  ORF Transcript_3997/g.12025 Transcript_3997/m.12025 type:complete len:224 (-) Transcript_3997:277-948(-)
MQITRSAVKSREHITSGTKQPCSDWAICFLRPISSGSGATPPRTTGRSHVPLWITDLSKGPVPFSSFRMSKLADLAKALSMPRVRMEMNCECRRSNWCRSTEAGSSVLLTHTKVSGPFSRKRALSFPGGPCALLSRLAFRFQGDPPPGPRSPPSIDRSPSPHLSPTKEIMACAAAKNVLIICSSPYRENTGFPALLNTNICFFLRLQDGMVLSSFGALFTNCF